MQDPNHFELALDKIVSEEVDRLLKEEEYSGHNKLTPPQVRRAQLEHQVRESLNLGEFEHYMESAVAIFKSEGSRYLSPQAQEALIEDLSKLYTQLETLAGSELTEQTFQKSLTISEEGKTSIFQIGIAKFKEGLYPDSLAVFAFLSAIDPNTFDYWYRLGLVAQECELHELAIRSFKAASDLVPGFMGSRIFIVQSHIQLSQYEEAAAELAEIKALLAKNKDEKWGSYVADLENLLTLTAGSGKKE